METSKGWENFLITGYPYTDWMILTYGCESAPWNCYLEIILPDNRVTIIILF